MREVDKFLDSLAPGERDTANRLRAIVSAAAPEVVEGFRWNAPSFIHAGDHKLTLGRNKDGGIRLVVHRGARPRPVDSFSFLDNEGLAEWPSADRGVMTFRSPEAVDRVAAQLQAFVARWLEAAR
jgi:hypothetical protein